MRCTLAYLNSVNSNWDITGLCNAFEKWFGEGTAYNQAYISRKTHYDPHNRSKFVGPVEGPWIHGSVREMLEGYRDGAVIANPSNNDYDGFLAALPLILGNVRERNSWEQIKEIALLFTTNPDTIKLYHVNFIFLQECIL